MRAALTRSNQIAIRALPGWLVMALTFHHEIWHYLAARSLGLPARIDPGVTVYRASADWQRVVVLLAPAAVGLALLPWPLWAAWWWAGCLGDFMDVGRIVAGYARGRLICG